jgi:pimeloyl-ACP methyl ester carboxylesterase
MSPALMPKDAEVADMETSENLIELEGRRIMFDVTGGGPPIVFVHGVWATGGVWYPVIERLATRFRCINLHLPLGVHRHPSPPAVDHSPQALAKVIAGLLEALDLHDVTLVGNDTGGALCQIVIARHPERIARLVLTNCDAFEMFPPRKLEPLYALARFPLLWSGFAQLGRLALFRRAFFATVARTAPDPAALEMLMKRFASVPGVREDLRQTIRGINPSITLEATKAFASFRRAVLVLWGTDDRFFPVSLGRRLAAAFPQSELQLIENARLFVGLDAPDAVATAIAGFVDAASESANTAA